LTTTGTRFVVLSVELQATAHFNHWFVSKWRTAAEPRMLFVLQNSRAYSINQSIIILIEQMEKALQSLYINMGRYYMSDIVLSMQWKLKPSKRSI